MIAQVSVIHNGMVIFAAVTSFEAQRDMPFAQTPDCPGYDDEGSGAEVEFDIIGIRMDCRDTFIEAGGIDLDCDEIRDKVIQEMCGA